VVERPAFTSWAAFALAGLAASVVLPVAAILVVARPFAG